METLAMCPEGGRYDSVCSGLSLKCKCIWGVKSWAQLHEEKEGSKGKGRIGVGRGGESQWAMLLALLCHPGESCPVSQCSALSDSNRLWLLFLLPQ